MTFPTVFGPYAIGDKAKNIDINSVSTYSGCILKKSTKHFI